jgi:hypothetical protein
MKRRSPLLSDEPHELLDHLEISSLADSDRNASAAQLRGDLGLAGSSDAMDEDEEDQNEVTESERMDGIVDAVLTEAEARIMACGEKNYPFLLRRKALLSRDARYTSVYTFLLLLSAYGEDAVPSLDAAKLFEDVSAHAAKVYFGSPQEPAHTFVFGFPRRIGPKDFPGALQELCAGKIREGQPDNKMPGVSSMKDAGLDIVTWKPFTDNRSSKLIAFGQCATGQNWREKRHELQPADWCRTWLLKTPQVHPIKVFFVPHAVNDKDWAALGYQAGIIFDRVRIAHFAEKKLPKVERSKIRTWSKSVLVELRSGAR